MEVEIPKVYAPETIEPRWAQYWIDQKLYRPSDDATRPRFCLVIPPPNITGSLHMGHMLEHTEIDILMRWHRMRGEDVLWLPGTDHASIATQMIVERELGREAFPDLEPGPDTLRTWQREGQKIRLTLGREKFLERCWKWKEESGGTIRRQMERLGASCDWTRERFTMDPAYSHSVQQVFVRLYHERQDYRDKLIYRDNYIVNWCPRCGTALSDLEVVHEERQGKLWYIKYPFEDKSGFITVATTRPETMFGDTAVAVSPNDDIHKEYKQLIGSNVKLPLTGRVIQIIADDFVDPAFGTGAVKVTPAHDPNDFAMGLRHNLQFFTVIGPDAHMTEAAGAAYQGLDRYEARESVLRDLGEQELLGNIQDYTLNVGVCQRCRTVVEPLLSMQWLMKMQLLAEPAVRAVEDGRIRILPESGRKKYLSWMNNIHDWCISRQLWWGHRIPAWYCEQCGTHPGEEIVQVDPPRRCPLGHDGPFHQDPEVLDTWFSSALWPFATLGWPEQTPDLKRFYPNDLMIMGEDILFFWGARMIMLGLKFMNDVPFRELYIHALVRDAERQKMSKTKGNVLDPLEVTEKYGTDAVRFALAISAAPGTDIAFSQDKVESYRAFANKIWNAGRFILMNLAKLPEAARDEIGVALEPLPGLGFEMRIAAPEPLSADDSGANRQRPGQLADRWIFSRLAAVTRELAESLAAFRFHEAAHTIYHFFWHEFCDWYVEWVKPEIIAASQDEASAAWINLARAFEASLHLLHPFMPFITEELWHQLPHAGARPSISLTAFELVTDRMSDPVSEMEFQVIQELVVAMRNAKAELGMQAKRPSAQVSSEDLRMIELFREHQETMTRLAGIEAMHFTRGHLAANVEGARATSFGDIRLFLDEPVDTEAERARLEKEKAKIEQSLEQIKKQLDNPSFVSRAPKEVVRGAELRHRELGAHYKKVVESLARLGASL